MAKKKVKNIDINKELENIEKKKVENIDINKELENIDTIFEKIMHEFSKTSKNLKGMNDIRFYYSMFKEYIQKFKK